MVLVAGWLTIGANRTATRIIHERPGTVSVWAVYGTILVLLVLTSLQLANLFFPPSSVIKHNNSKPPKVIRNGSDIYITGDIDYRTLTELRPLLTSHTPATTIWLNSTGGHVIAGRSIGLVIEQAGLDTTVEGQCYSACTLVFAGGKQRVLTTTATLGFHGYRYDSTQRVRTITSVEIQAKDRIFLRRRGVSTTFLDKVFNVKPENIWIPSHAELLAAGVITK